MAATNPVVELITRDIVTKIDAITEDNGFNQDLNAVRPMRLGNDAGVSLVNGVVIVHQDDPDVSELDADKGAAGLKAWIQPYALECFVIQDDLTPGDTGTPIDTLINRVKADIEKKLMEDHTRGGNAIETRLDGSMKFVDEGNATITGIVVFVSVQYRVKLTDPYSEQA